MPTRLNYQPAIAVVYLDKQSISFLRRNPGWNLWKIFIEKVHTVFPELKFLINAKELFEDHSPNICKAENLELFSSELTELQFLAKVGLQLPKSKFDDPDWDEVCFLYFSGISPLVDLKLMAESFERHKRYFSQYSYSENLPEGLIPKVLTREFLSSLPDALSSDTHSFFLKNINQYDVDIFFVPPDLRQYRLDFRVSNYRNYSLILKFLEHVASKASLNQIEYDEILPLLEANPSWFREAPSYIEWEIIQACELKCTFCPRQDMDLSKDGTFVSLEDASRFISIWSKEILSDFTIALGGNGEPFLHPNWKEIVHLILDIPQLKELIIESALYNDFDSLRNELIKMPETKKSKLSFIVNLTTLKPDRYSNLYGAGLHKVVLEKIKDLKSILPPQSLNVQMIKMLDVKDEIEEYFNFFEKLGINVILQKYNSFAGKLKEKRVSDLTPIRREFCWHLNRDLYVNADGGVAICKQLQSFTIGNMKSESFSDIWKKGEVHFNNSFLGKHNEIPAPCLNCDEWYTFNA